MSSIIVHQHEEFERSTSRWIWLCVVVSFLVVLSFIAPLWLYDGYWESIWSWSNRLNAIILLIIVWSYLYAAVFYNKDVTITYNDLWMLSREWKPRVQLQDYASYSLTHHGSKEQYYTLFLLNDSWYIEKILPFADSTNKISEFIDYIEQYLSPNESVELYWYEKLQRRLKI